MKHKRTYKVKDMEWVQPIKKGYLLGCCDCALYHWMDFRIVKGKIQFRAKRARNYTARFRRKERIRVTIK